VDIINEVLVWHKRRTIDLDGRPKDNAVVGPVQRGRNMFGKPWTGLERANCWMLQSGSSGTVLAETGFAVQLVIWRNSQPNRSVSIGRDFGIK
jgi:hypothetical protein